MRDDQVTINRPQHNKICRKHNKIHQKHNKIRWKHNNFHAKVNKIAITLSKKCDENCTYIYNIYQ